MNRFALIGLLLCSFTTPAQTVVSTVQEALAMARRSNPELVNARQNRLVQDQQRAATRAALLPQARFFTNFDYNYALPVQLIPAEFFPGGTPGQYRSIQFGLPYVLAAGAEVTLPVINRPARADLGIVEQNLRITDNQTLVLQDDISTQTARVYHAALLTRSAIAITRRNLASTDTLTQIARQRLDKGLIEPLEYNRIRSVQLTTADVLYQNELNYVRNLNQLKLLLGLAPGDSLVLSEDLATRPANQPVPLTINTVERPQITLRQARVELSKLQLDRERLQRWPTLSAYGRITEQAQRSQINFLNTNEPWYRIGVAGLQFNWPLYTGGLRTSNLTRARRQLKLAESELAYERNKQQTDTEDVRNTYNQAIRSLDLNRQNYELSSQNVQIALVKYRSGLFAYDQYLNVFNEVLTAQNRYLNNLSNVFINQTILQIRNGQ